MSKKYPMAQAVRDAYRAGEEDEALEPRVLVDAQGKPVGRIGDGDYAIFYDIRGEREIELTSSFTDNLPAGMVIAGTPNVATTCGGAGALTANPGGSAVTMATGRTIPAGSSCTLTVNVTTPLAGTYVDTVPSGALVTSFSNSTTSASATLTSNAATTSGTGSQPKEVPEADTLLLFGGGVGGLATWLGWQWRKVRSKNK